MKKSYYQLAVRDPGAVAWYCAVKLEMATALTAALLTEQLQSDDVPGRADAQNYIEAELAARVGADASVSSRLCQNPDQMHFGQVDDYYMSYEWSEGHDPRAHGILGRRGSPH